MERRRTYCVYVKFVSNPLDVRQFRVSDEVTLQSFDKLVRDEYGRHYTDFPEEILYYVEKTVAAGRKIMVLATSVLNFFYDDAVVVAYGMWDSRDTSFPSDCDYDTEVSIFTGSNAAGRA